MAITSSSLPADQQRQQRADPRGWQRRQNGDRVNKAFIQHAQHDIHRHHGGNDQPDGAAERGLERQSAALELGGNIGRQVQRLLAVDNRLNGFAQ
jgi:hypothetical protein